MVTCLSISATLAAAFAVLVGTVFLSEIPKKLGLYRYMASKNPQLIGFTPAMLYGVPWKYTLEELYEEKEGLKKNDLSGQNVIVTGGNAGIGFELAKACALLNAHVTIACRNPTKCKDAAARIKRAGGSAVSTLPIDTSSLQSVKDFAEAYTSQNESASLDVLFLNAGTAFGDPSQKCVPKSDDGIEYVFQTNYLGHHLLYRLLEPLLQKSKQARVVQTSSSASFDSYSYKVATDLETLNGCKENHITKSKNLSYGQSKFAQVLWVKELTRRLGPDSNIYANAFHPGMVHTEIFGKTVHEKNTPAWARHFIEWLKENKIMWMPEEGALTGIFLAVETDRIRKEDIRGRYYHPQAEPFADHPLAKNEDKLQRDLWEFSDDLVKDYL